MNTNTERTIWDEWNLHVHKTYEPAWFKNGFWIPDTQIKTHSANECIEFFLKRVGGLKMRDLDAMTRLNSLEARVNQLAGDHDSMVQLAKDTQTVANKNRLDLEVIQQLKEQKVEASSMTSKPTRVETVKSADTHRKSPKRKKPNDVKSSDEEDSDADSDTAPTAAQKQPVRVPKPGRTSLSNLAVSGLVEKGLTWTQVVRRKPRIKTVVGKRDNTSDSIILGGSGVVDMVISGIRRTQGATDEEYIEKLKTYLLDNGIDMTDGKITLLTKDPNKRTLAFKLTVTREQKDKVYDPEFWPSFVYVRKFVPSFRK